MIGGKLLSEGGFGCVFNPSICINEIRLCRRYGIFTIYDKKCK